MAERMKRKVISIPRPLDADFKLCVKKDGRSEGEIIRALVEQWMREITFCQSRLHSTR